MNTSQKRRPPRRESAVLHVLHRFSAWLYALILGSLLGRLMTGGQGSPRSDGFLSRLRHSKKKRSDRIFFRFCQAISRTLERSLVCRGLGALARALLRCSIKSYGIFFLFFGCFSIVSYYVNDALSGAAPFASLVSGVGCMVISLPMFASSRSMACGLRSSKILHRVVIGLFGIAEERLTSYGDSGREHYLTALILALLCGGLTFLVPPHWLLAVAAGVLLVLLILRDPEVGMVVSVALLPFLALTPYPTRALILLAGVTLLGYVVKLLCGKRTLRMEATDWCMVLLLFLFGMGGIITRGGTESLYSAVTYVALGSIYFVVANLVRSQSGVWRLMTVLLFGCTAVALLGVWQYVFSTPSLQYLDLSLFADLGGRVSSLWGNPNMLAEHLALLLPLAFAMLILQRRLLRGFGAMLCFAASAACLVFTWSRGAWLGVLLAILLFLLCLSHKALSWVLIGALPAAALLPFAPQNILRRFASIGSRTDTSILYRIHLWEGVEQMLGDHWLTGVGVGESAFCAVYATYALPGIETAMHSHSLYLQLLCSLGVVGLAAFALVMLFWLRRALGYVRYGQLRTPRLVVLGGVAGIVALLVMGIFDDVWYNYRIYMLFWVLMGLVTAQVRIAERETERANNPISDVRTQGEIVFHFQ